MRRLILVALVAGMTTATAVAAQTTPDPARLAVETGLQPAVVFDGRRQAWTIDERMSRWSVPGVSVAVIDGGRVVWARGYGVIAAGEPAPVTADTRFQAASISKPIAAAVALSLVQEGRLTLDGDVNETLSGWTLPDNAFNAERPVTLRALLSHTGGTTVHGFPGYAQGVPVPTLTQVLTGSPPANTAAIVSERRPGEAWKYSGGGYEIVQRMIEDATGRPFADQATDRVFAPAGMTRSRYDVPAAGEFAMGHGMDGRPIPGGWHTYPEQAAAGLWTTPTDLALFGLALARAHRGEDGAILDPTTATAMMSPVMGDYGLGPGVSGEGAALAVSHGGSNEGYRAFWVIHPVTGDGVAVMTNGDGGSALAMEIVRSVAGVYGWPDYAPGANMSHALPPEVLEARAGVWSTDSQGDRVAMTLRRDGDGLLFETARGTYRFSPTDPATMVAADTGATATFVEQTGGPTTLRVYGLELSKEDVAASPASGF